VGQIRKSGRFSQVYDTIIGLKYETRGHLLVRDGESHVVRLEATAAVRALLQQRGHTNRGWLHLVLQVSQQSTKTLRMKTFKTVLTCILIVH